MVIHEYYYTEEKSTLHVEFSTEEDGDNFYRVLDIEFDSIEYYSPTIITEHDLSDIDEEFVIELLLEYLKENDLPERVSL